jgi:hypothetical protein
MAITKELDIEELLKRITALEMKQSATDKLVLQLENSVLSLERQLREKSHTHSQP